MSVLASDSRHKISLELNGKQRTGHAEPRMLLSDFLRHELGATGTHVGCEHGVCGACTVQIDGAPARSCLTLAVQTDRCRIDTIEGLAETDNSLSILQQCFRKNHALQCGFCTAGILMSLSAYLRAQPDPTENDLRELLSGHICRCTGYAPILVAALEAAELLRSVSASTLESDNQG